MYPLTQRDLRSLMKVCQALLVPCQLEEFYTKLLSCVSEIVASDISASTEVNFHTRSISTFSSSLSDTSTLTHAAIEEVARDHFYEHPLITNFLATQDYGAYKISDFLSERELHRLPGLYEKLLHPLGVEDQFSLGLSMPQGGAIQGRLHQPQSKLIWIGLYRSDRTFSERDRTLLNLLRPHLLQALQNAAAFTQTQQELQALKQTINQLGLIGLSNQGQVHWISDRAWSWLQQYDLLSVRQKGRLSESLDRWINYQIALQTQAQEQPCSFSRLCIERSDRRLTLRLIATTMMPHSDTLQALPNHSYLLLIEEELLIPFRARSLEVLGLTPREAEVLYWIIQDKQNSEIAAILGIQVGTLKKHIEHLYTKLGVQTRTAAILNALERLGLLHESLFPE